MRISDPSLELLLDMSRDPATPAPGSRDSAPWSRDSTEPPHLGLGLSSFALRAATMDAAAGSQRTLRLAVTSSFIFFMLGLASIAVAVWTRTSEPAFIPAPPERAIVTDETRAVDREVGYPTFGPPTPEEQDRGSQAPAAASASEEASEASQLETSAVSPQAPRSARRTPPPRSATTRSLAPAPIAPPAQQWDTGSADTNPQLADSLDALLDRAVGPLASDQGDQTAASDAPSLPQTPTRRQVLDTLRALEGDVRMCAEGRHGTVRTTIVVAGASGRVTSARVNGDFAGSPQGSCMARTLRTARFPRFAREHFEVAFPYRL